MTDQVPCETTSLTRKLRGLRNPKLIRSFASSPELEKSLVETAAKTGLSISEIIRNALIKELIEG